jgi:RimJ/RimL family protein N-acetyltransferase
MMGETLETDRLRIRPLAVDDLEACHRLYSDIGWGDPELAEAERRRRTSDWLDWTVRSYVELARLRQPPYGERAVVARDGGDLVGLVGLVPMLAPFAQLPSLGGRPDAPFSAEVGLFWAIAPRVQRRGYATEAGGALVAHAFAHLRLGRIFAGTKHGNAASIAVMRRLGMRIETNPYPDPPWFQVCGVALRPG